MRLAGRNFIVFGCGKRLGAPFNLLLHHGFGMSLQSTCTLWLFAFGPVPENGGSEPLG